MKQPPSRGEDDRTQKEEGDRPEGRHGEAKVVLRHNETHCKRST